MKPDKIILPENSEAVEKVTETFWKTREGKYYSLKDEKTARWSGATHIKCECGKITDKRYTKCEECRRRAEIERFNKLEKKKWDGDTPITLYDGYKYFYSLEELDDYCIYDCDGDVKPEDLMLVLCKRTTPRELEPSEFFKSLFPENDDWDLPKEIYEAAKEFNDIVSSFKDQMTWEPSNIAVIL